MKYINNVLKLLLCLGLCLLLAPAALAEETGGQTHAGSLLSASALPNGSGSSGPKITVQPQNFNAVINGWSGTGTCYIKAEGENLTYQWEWQRRGENEWKSEWTILLLDGSHKNTITVMPSQKDAGNYNVRCVVKDSNGKEAISNVVSLTILIVGPHTHDKGTLLYNEAAHPHRSVYKCSLCDEEWVDNTSLNYSETCETCQAGFRAVTYNANGGTGEPAAQAGKIGENLTLSSTNPSRERWTFTGWTCNGRTYSPGETITLSENLNLVAAWEPLVYSGTCGENLTWRLSCVEGVLAIHGTGPMYDYENSSEVPWYDCKNFISYVVISYGTTSIGKNAFTGSSNLVGADIAESVLSIGDNAFCGTGIQTVSFPSSLQEIGSYAFNGSALTSVELSGVTVKDSAFSSCSDLASVSLSNVKTGSSAFSSNRKLSQVTIGNKVELGSNAFYNCGANAAMSVAINGPDTVIGNYAFARGGSEQYPMDLNFGEGVTLGNYLFEQAHIGTLELPSNYVEGIPENTRPFDEYSSYGSGYRYTIDKLVIEKAGDGEMPDGTSALCFIGNVREAEFQEGITHISAWILNKENSSIALTKVTLPSTLKSIGAYAFRGQSVLTEIQLPDGLEKIGDYAFCGTGIQTVSFPGSLQEIGSYAFYNCALTDVFYSGSSSQWDLVLVGEHNDPFSSATFHFATVIPDPDLILPAALTKIEDEAFAGGAFVYVKLPDKAVSIGWHAFADCPNLAYIYIPAQTTQIDGQAFGNMQGLTILGMTGSTAETYAQNHNYSFIAVP